MSDELTLGGLFASSFLAATLLPGGSEIVLYGVLRTNPQLLWQALALATLGNTLGGMSSYLIGRLIPNRLDPSRPGMARWQARGLDLARRHGSLALLGAWIPLIGDPLCVAAGWLRLGAIACMAWMALGKFARYAVIAAAA